MTRYARYSEGLTHAFDGIGDAAERVSLTDGRPGVRALRAATGLNQTTVAAMVGTDPRTLRRWENGEADPPLMYRMLMLAVSACPEPGMLLRALSHEARSETP